MLRVDAWTKRLFQNGYDFLWDEFAVQIGTFRMIIALVPLGADFGLRLFRELPIGDLLGSCILVGVLFWMFYDPSMMVADNRQQARGSYASLNATSLAFSERTLALRLFYIGLFPSTLILFHHVDGFALFDIVYARCINVRASGRRHPSYRPQYATADG